MRFCCRACDRADWPARRSILLRRTPFEQSRIPFLTFPLRSAGFQDNVLYAGCGDSCVHSWDISAARKQPPQRPHYLRSYEGHTDYVLCLAVRQCGQLVSGSEDGTVRLWGMCVRVSP